MQNRQTNILKQKVQNILSWSVSTRRCFNVADVQTTFMYQRQNDVVCLLGAVEKRVLRNSSLINCGTKAKNLYYVINVSRKRRMKINKRKNLMRKVSYYSLTFLVTWYNVITKLKVKRPYYLSPQVIWGKQSMLHEK